jgi:hypothetical protein
MQPILFALLFGSLGASASPTSGWVPGLQLQFRSTASMEVLSTAGPTRQTQGVTSFRVEVREGPDRQLELLLHDVTVETDETDPELAARWLADTAWTRHLEGLHITRRGAYVGPIDAAATARMVAEAYPSYPHPPDSATVTAVTQTLWLSMGGMAAAVASRGEGSWEDPGTVPMLVEGGQVPASIRTTRQLGQPCGENGPAECVLVRQVTEVDAAAAIPLLEAQVGMDITALSKISTVEQLVDGEGIPLRTSNVTRMEVTANNGQRSLTETEIQTIEIDFTRME